MSHLDAKLNIFYNRDPNLWTVKCKSGEEKATALLLMRKYNAYLNKSDKQPLAIKSVIVKEGLRGFIYVEAYKQTHVKSAIEEISNLKMGVWKQEVMRIYSLYFIQFNL